MINAGAPVRPSQPGSKVPIAAIMTAPTRTVAITIVPAGLPGPALGVGSVMAPPSAHALHGRLAVDCRQAVVSRGGLRAAPAGWAGGAARWPALGRYPSAGGQLL